MALHKRTKECLDGLCAPKHCARSGTTRSLDAARDLIGRLRTQAAEWRNHVEGAMAKESDVGIRQAMYSLKAIVAGMTDSVEKAAKAIAEATDQLRAIESRAAELATMAEEKGYVRSAHEEADAEES